MQHQQQLQVLTTQMSIMTKDLKALRQQQSSEVGAEVEKATAQARQQLEEATAEQAALQQQVRRRSSSECITSDNLLASRHWLVLNFGQPCC